MVVFTIPIEGGQLSKKTGIGILIGFIIFIIAFIIAAIASTSAISANYNEQYHVSEQVCEKCHSHNIEGYHTFWNNDGTIAKNEKDADYTIMHCNDCGYNWHYEFNNK